ncbi:MAG: PDZ domain-containing protein [Planctomycetota bacterium]
MTRFRTRAFSRTALTLAAIAGLPAAAIALTPQDAAPTADRYEVVAETAPTQSVREIVMTRSQDGHAVTVRERNGKLTAEINGKKVDASRIERKGDTIVVLDDTGRAVTFRVPRAPSAPVTLLGGVAPELEIVQLARPAPAVRVGVAQVQDATDQPRVMFGVVMGEPDNVLLEHLGLDGDRAVLLERVIDGLPAAKAGLKAKDIIVGFGDHAEPRSADDIRVVLRKAEPGKKVKVKVIRKGQAKTFDVKLEAFDATALGRAPTAGGGVGARPPAPPAAPRAQDANPWRGAQGQGQGRAMDHAEQAEAALKQAAEMIARLQGEAAHEAHEAHEHAQHAMRRAIEALRKNQQQAFTFDAEELRGMQNDALARLRELEGDGARFWAEHQPGQGFTFRLPPQEWQGFDSESMEDRLEALEDRLEDFEDRFEDAIERFEDRMEAMVERLMHRLEQSLERDRARGRSGGGR